MKQENDMDKPPMWQQPHIEYTIAPEPEYAGYYEIGKDGGFRIMLQKKLSWVARTMSRVLLEWYWVDTVK